MDGALVVPLLLLDLALHVHVFELLQLLLWGHSLLLLGVQKLVGLVLVEARLERDEFANCPVYLSKARGCPCELASMAAHVIVLIAHGLDGAVGDAIHGLLVGVGRHQALIPILLVVGGLAKGLLEAARARQRGQAACLVVGGLTAVDDVCDLAHGFTHLQRFFDLYGEATQLSKLLIYWGLLVAFAKRFIQIWSFHI